MTFGTIPFVSGLLLVLAGLVAPSPAHRDGSEELKTIDQELQQEAKLLRETMNEAGPEQSGAIYEEYAQTVLPEFAERYADIARSNAGSSVAFEAWVKVLGLSARGMRHAISGEALRTLASDHLEVPELAGTVMNLRYATSSIDEDTVIESLRAFGASPNRSVKGAALFTLGAVLGDDRPVGDPRLTEATRILAQLKDFDDVDFRGTTYASAAASLLYALENLAVGSACPDFTAVDAEDVAFKLSDYRGKVVLVDFWGFW